MGMEKTTSWTLLAFAKEIILPSIQKISEPSIQVSTNKRNQKTPLQKWVVPQPRQPMIFSDIWSHIMYIWAEECNFTLVLAISQGRCIDSCAIIIELIYWQIVSILIHLVKIFNSNRSIKHLCTNIIIYNSEHNKQI
jgi:hypothetical protein